MELKTKKKAALGLAEIIEDKLKSYFEHLDGVKPSCGLYGAVLGEVEKPLLTVVLASVKGNKVKAAEILGINRNTLSKKVREHNIK